MGLPKGKVKPFCSHCGEVGQLERVQVEEFVAIRCIPCRTLYKNHEEVWEAMKSHPKFESHVSADMRRMLAAEEKRKMRLEKKNMWGKPG